MIYLDNAATTFPKPERVYDALEVANRELSLSEFQDYFFLDAAT